MHFHRFAPALLLVTVVSLISTSALKAQPTGHLKADLLYSGYVSPSAELAVDTGAVITESSDESTHTSEPLLLLGGVAGGTAGFLAGGLIGVAMMNQAESPFLITGLLVTSAIGTAIGTPLGVHLTNRRRGNYGLALLASAAIEAAAIGLFIKHNKEHNPGLADRILLIGAPIAQLGTSVVIEINTSD